ncbi:MAG: hypothetical protein KF835_15960 [Xanthobacteraceae bacterium]|nr:hypothetical protein [Xanthobacteraceae bacterium]
MMLTLLLAKVFGVALIAVSIALLAKREFFEKITRDFLKQDLLRLVVSFSEMLAGLFIVLGHNRWEPLPAALITLLGWGFVVEGGSYLLLPRDWTERIVNAGQPPALLYRDRHHRNRARRLSRSVRFWAVAATVISPHLASPLSTRPHPPRSA